MHPTRSLQTPSQTPELQGSGYSFSSPAHAFCNTGSSLLKVASNHQDWHVLAEVWRCFLLTPTETLSHPDRESHHPTVERKDAYLIRENSFPSSNVRCEQFCFIQLSLRQPQEERFLPFITAESIWLSHLKRSPCLRICYVLFPLSPLCPFYSGTVNKEFVLALAPVHLC